MLNVIVSASLILAFTFWGELQQNLINFFCYRNIQIRDWKNMLVPHTKQMSLCECLWDTDQLSVGWMWCYRSTKSLCWPIQQCIQAGISSPWRGLWCTCASGCLISVNRRGLDGWTQLGADFHCVGLVECDGLCALHFGVHLNTLHAHKCHAQVYLCTQFAAHLELVYVKLVAVLHSLRRKKNLKKGPKEYCFFGNTTA